MPCCYLLFKLLDINKFSQSDSNDGEFEGENINGYHLRAELEVILGEIFASM